MGFCEKLLCKSLVGAILFMAVVLKKHTLDALLPSDARIPSETTRQGLAEKPTSVNPDSQALH